MASAVWQLDNRRLNERSCHGSKKKSSRKIAGGGGVGMKRRQQKWRWHGI